MDQKSFELICKLKDTGSSNLNDLFEKYGCSTLEATVPVVCDQVVKKLEEADPEQQMYATLALKTESVDLLRKGRIASTKDRTLNIVGINGQTMIAAGKQRSRSPTPEKEELDEDIEEYMKERKRLKAVAQGIEVDEDWDERKPIKEEQRKGRKPLSPKPPTPQPIQIGDSSMCAEEELDTDLESYMAEARRRKKQSKAMTDLSERMNQMEAIEAIDYDVDL